MAFPGLYNALSQTLLQLTSPGMPDVYQGEELWRFSLVDPDNRREVDFAKRKLLLTQMHQDLQGGQTERIQYLQDLIQHMEDGRIKLFVIHQTLQFRNRNTSLFSGGEYCKLECRGKHAENVIAFGRYDKQQTAIIVAPRCITNMLSNKNTPMSAGQWSNTYVELPDVLPTSYQELFSGQWISAFASDRFEAEHSDIGQVRLEQSARAPRRALWIGDILRYFPLAILHASL